jgi:RNA 3'-terminal phosphate cyclase (ATP)
MNPAMSIHLDGATGEGGGQILRTALALSMCTGRPFVMENIRARRAKPGLMRQHLACVQSAASVCGAQVQGDQLQSTTLSFEPGSVRAGEYEFNIATAGSCTLVLQTVLPALMLADGPSTVQLGGGTHNPMAPPYPFIAHCFAPLLRRLGVALELELLRPGFYPAGGGRIVARIVPAAAAALEPVDIVERGAAQVPYAECLSPALPRTVAQRELAALGAALGWAGEQLRNLRSGHGEGPGNALMATLAHAQVTELLTSFGEKGVPAEQVAATLAAEVKAYQASDGALGEHLADQWMLPLALAVARHRRPAVFTCTKVSGHARTQIDTVEAFLPVRFAVAEQGSAWSVTLSPV